MQSLSICNGFRGLDDAGEDIGDVKLDICKENFGEIVQA